MQFVDLWLPGGVGRHPVVVMIHGGCWLASLPGVGHFELIDPTSDARRPIKPVIEATLK